MKSEITIKYNTELFQDLEAFVNKHQDDIETMTTLYDDNNKGLFVVTLKFFPIMVHFNREEETNQIPIRDMSGDIRGYKQGDEKT